jgi:hypothetical protein
MADYLLNYQQTSKGNTKIKFAVIVHPVDSSRWTLYVAFLYIMIDEASVALDDEEFCNYRRI